MNTVNRTVNRDMACVALGLFLGAAGGLVPAETLVEWLDPGAQGDHREAIFRGAIVLKVLVIVDGVLLLALAGFWASRNNARDNTPAWVPLWTASPDTLCLGPAAAYFPLLVALMIAAAALRLIGLGNDLWMDEVFTVVDFVRLSSGQILTDFSDDNQHMLYSLAARTSVSVFGENPVALRLPSLLFGLGSLWAVARLSRLTLGRREALLAVALLAVSYHHIWFSQNARGYTALLLGTVLATELLLRALASGRVLVWIAYAVTLAMTAWAHLTIVFVGLAHFILVAGLLLREGTLSRGRWRALAAFALAGWLTLHCYALVLPQLLDFFSQPAAGSTTAPVEWRSPVWLVNETFRHLGLGLAMGWLGVAGALVLFGWGVLRCGRRDPILTTAMILPAVLLGGTMVILGRNLWPRFFFNEIGFAAMLAVAGAIGMGEALGKIVRFAPRFVALAPALLLCLVSLVSVPRVYRYPKQDYTGARDFVREQLLPGDRVVGLDMAGRVYHRYYAVEWPEIASVDELAAHQAPDGRTWILYTLPRYLAAAKPELTRMLEMNFELVRTFPGTLGDGVIIVRRSRTSEGSIE
jgi:hypothetical protein